MKRFLYFCIWIFIFGIGMGFFGQGNITIENFIAFTMGGWMMFGILLVTEG